MLGNARGTYESGGKVPGERRGMQGNTGEYRGMPAERMGVGAKCLGYAGECRGMPGERMGVGVNCHGNAGNAGECQGNVCERVYSARERQGTTRIMQGSGCKVLSGMKGNEGECQGNVRVEAKCKGNAVECRGLQG